MSGRAGEKPIGPPAVVPRALARRAERLLGAGNAFGAYDLLARESEGHL